MKPLHKFLGFFRNNSAQFVLASLVALGLAFQVQAIDLVHFTGLTGPLTSALTQMDALGPQVEALVGFLGFVVALISLSALRNFGPVLFYVGVAVFATVGLTVAGSIMGCDLSQLAGV